MSGQSIRDRVNAAMLSIAGQGLAKSVCKSTTEEIMGPKKKHLDYLLQCTNEPNVSIPQLADLLVERTQLPSWVAVFKSLITIHNLMNYGNERFTQYLASSNCSFNLSGFLDKSGVQVSHPTGSSSTDSHPMKTEGYDMSTFIRRYGKYLNEKAVSYRLMAFDFCKVRRGKDDGTLRTMNAEKLLKTLPILQAQLDALLEFDCTPNELTNGVINACFLLMFKDLIRLFACYNDGIINLLEKYFDMNKKQCKEALEIYKKFLVRMDKVSEFLKVAENVGIDKGDIPDLAKAPSSLLDALEQHLASLEGKKVATNVNRSGVTAGELDCGTGDRPDGFTAALNTMANASAAFSVSDDEKKLIIEEENMRLHQLKEQRLKELNQASPPATSPQSQPTSILQSTNPFSSAIPAQAESPSINFLGTSVAPTKPSDDLLSLSGNPFADSIQNTIAVNSVSPSTAPMTSTPWGSQAPSVPLTTTPSGSAVFASDDAFAAVFPNSTPSASVGLDVSPINIVTSPAAANPAAPMDLGDPLDLLDPLLTGAMAITSSSPTAGPQRSLTPSFLETASCMGRASPALSTTSDPGFDAFGDVLQPQKNASEKKDPTGKLIQGDLESSLAQLAGNLNINGPASQVKKTEHQWHPKGEQRKTGGANFQGPSPSSATLSSMWGGGNQQFTQPPISGSQMGFTSPVAPQQQMAMGQPRPIGMSPVPPAAGIGITQPIFGMSQPNLQSVGIQRVPQSTTQTQPNDPFGAL